MISLKSKGIIISRTDNIGDVVLTLPVAGLIKKLHPELKVFFIGKSYTKPIIEACTFVDEFIDREEVIVNNNILKLTGANIILHVFPDKLILKAAYQAGIKLRIATSHRLSSWLYANKLLNFSRKGSQLHEAQLNTILLKPLGFPVPDLNELARLYGLSKLESVPNEYCYLVNGDKFVLVLHPKSKGSAREWPLAHYLTLAKWLAKYPVHIVLTGTETEGNAILAQCPELLSLPNVLNLTGKLGLGQLMAVISKSNGLVACSTGPLHLASALGIHALGNYPPMRPLHPGRWAPIGPLAEFLVEKNTCNLCQKSGKCLCIESISPSDVESRVLDWYNQWTEDSRLSSNSDIAL